MSMVLRVAEIGFTIAFVALVLTNGDKVSSLVSVGFNNYSQTVQGLQGRAGAY